MVSRRSRPTTFIFTSRTEVLCDKPVSVRPPRNVVPTWSRVTPLHFFMGHVSEPIPHLPSCSPIFFSLLPFPSSYKVHLSRTTPPTCLVPYKTLQSRTVPGDRLFPHRHYSSSDRPRCPTTYFLNLAHES